MNALKFKVGVVRLVVPLVEHMAVLVRHKVTPLQLDVQQIF